jgi:protein involved in polysaccharide export with SLBB domain
LTSRLIAGFAAVLCFLTALLVPVGAAHAQDTAVGFQATRAALAQRVAADEAELASSKTRGSRRKQVQGEVATIKDRLDNGDFRTGDLLVVTVSTAEKGAKVDTSTVRENGMISISTLPDVSVKGVLRSEVQNKIMQHVMTYIKFPQVRVNFTTRVTVLGAVAKPGTYNVSPDRQLTELVTTAGGGTPTAKLDQLEVRRGGKVVLSEKDSKKALVEGQTLEQAGIQPGDEIFVPAKRGFNWQIFLQTAALITTLSFAVITFLQYYYSNP